MDIANQEYQHANMWDLHIYADSADDDDVSLSIYDTSLDLPQLLMSARSDGRKYIDGFRSEDSVSITFLVDKQFNNFKYFQNWLSIMYDYKKRVYRTIAKGSLNDRLRYRRGVVNFASHKETGRQISTIKFVMVNMRPLGFSSLRLNDTSNEPLSFSVDFAIDRVEIDDSLSKNT